MLRSNTRVSHAEARDVREHGQRDRPLVLEALLQHSCTPSHMHFAWLGPVVENPLSAAPKQQVCVCVCVCPMPTALGPASKLS